MYHLYFLTKYLIGGKWESPKCMFLFPLFIYLYRLGKCMKGSTLLWWTFENKILHRRLGPRMYCTTGSEPEVFYRSWWRFLCSDDNLLWLHFHSFLPHPLSPFFFFPFLFPQPFPFPSCFNFHFLLFPLIFSFLFRCLLYFLFDVRFLSTFTSFISL